MAITTRLLIFACRECPHLHHLNKSSVRRKALYKSSTLSEIKKAEALVKAAINEQSAYNNRLFANPHRNVMKAMDGSFRRRNTNIPKYKLNSTVAAAVALLAELQAAQVVTNTSSARPRSSTRLVYTGMWLK